MKQTKAEARDRKHHKAQHGMRVNGKSCLLLQEILVKKAERAKQDKRKGSYSNSEYTPFFVTTIYDWSSAYTYSYNPCSA